MQSTNPFVNFDVIFDNNFEKQDFAPLFANWVNSRLGIELSNNLLSELKDGRVGIGKGLLRVDYCSFDSKDLPILPVG